MYGYVVLKRIEPEDFFLIFMFCGCFVKQGPNSWVYWFLTAADLGHLNFVFFIQSLFSGEAPSKVVMCLRIRKVPSSTSMPELGLLSYFWAHFNAPRLQGNYEGPLAPLSLSFLQKMTCHKVAGDKPAFLSSKEPYATPWICVSFHVS